MGLITINYENFGIVCKVETIECFPEVYPVVFNEETGSLPGLPVHLIMVNEAQCCVCPAPRLPEAVKEKESKELDDMVEAGKIVSVDKPADWVNQMSVTVKKSGDLRICIDPR